MTAVAEHVGRTEAVAPSGSRVRRLVFACATAWYAIFIGRASFTMGGQRAFSLFDDGMISLTYARNLARGHGLVWNVGGPRVEGITNLGWTLIMAVPELFRVPDRFAALVVQLVGVAILLGCGAVAGRIAEVIAPARRHVRTVATVLTLAYYPLVYWTLRGMEVGWLTLLLLVLLAVCVGATGRQDTRAVALASIAAALGVLTRLDFTLFVVAIVAWLLWQRDDVRKRLLASRIALATSSMVVAQEVFRRVYYGSWVPNTYALKLGGVPLGDRVFRGGAVLEYAVATSLVALLVFVTWAWQSGREARAATGLILLAAATAAAYEVYVGGDAWEWMRYADRYLAPAVAVLLIPAAIGLCAAADGAVARRSIVRGLLAVAAASLLVLGNVLPGGRRVFAIGGTAVSATAVSLSGVVFIAVVAWLLHHPTPRRWSIALLTAVLVFQVSGPAVTDWVPSNAAYARFDAQHARAGDALRRSTPKDATIAVAAAGATVFFAHRDAIDVLGKMDSAIARESIHPGWFFWPGHMKWDYSVTLAHKPDLVVGPWLPLAGDLDALRRAGYGLWAVTPNGIRVLGLRAGDDRTFFAAPTVGWLDRRLFMPLPFPSFKPTVPVLFG